MRLTLKHVAEMAGVSGACVSNILNGKTKEYSQATIDKVRKIAEENNYRVNRIAKSMVTKSTMIIGLIIPDITNPFYPEIARGVEDAAKKLGYTVVYLNTDEDPEKEKEALINLESNMVDGVILIPSVFSGKNETLIKKMPYPIVALDRNYFNSKLGGTVICDDFTGSNEIVKHLLEKGRKKILYLSGDRHVGCTANEIFDRFYNQQELDKDMPMRFFGRERGFFNSLKEHGVPFEREYFMVGNYTPEFGYQAIMEFLKTHKKFDAVYAGVDMIAIGVIQALKEANIKIPEDVAVIGYDNIYISKYLDPMLTTVNQPKYEMGRKSVQMLIKVIEHGKKEEDEILILQPNLILRESS